MHITPTPQSSHTFQHNLSVSNDSKKHIISTGGQRQIIGIEIYKAYVHRNIFNDREFEYRLTLNTEEQWRLLQSNRSRIFIPKSKTKPRTEREVVHYEHLDLMGLFMRNVILLNGPRELDMSIITKGLHDPPQFLSKFKNPCWYDGNKLLRCLPYFYLIGAPKCGTTDLHNKLEKHEDFISSRTKEPHWFSRGRFERNQSEFRFTDYLSYFSKLSEQLNNANLGKDLMKQLITGDCSASTMWDNSEWTSLPRNENPMEPVFINADYIHYLNPNTKIIFILRNPVTRLYSDYLYFEKESRKSPANFHRKVVDAIHIFTACLRETSLRSCVYNRIIEHNLQVRLHVGIYFIYLTEWYKKFPRHQILPLSLEEYSRSLNDSLVKIFTFLDMRMPTDSRFYKMASSRRVNTRSNRNINVGPMWIETRQMLYKFYKPFNTMLAQLLQDEKFDYGFP